METVNEGFNRDRDAEEALFEQLSINRDNIVEKFLAALGVDKISEDDFQYLRSFVKDFENNQSKVLQAYHHEKTMNDNYFNGMYE